MRMKNRPCGKPSDAANLSGAIDAQLSVALLLPVSAHERLQGRRLLAFAPDGRTLASGFLAPVVEPFSLRVSAGHYLGLGSFRQAYLEILLTDTERQRQAADGCPCWPARPLLKSGDGLWG
jgi:hypothetical protein